MTSRRSLLLARAFALPMLCAAAFAARADVALGMTSLPDAASAPAVTIFYPAAAADTAVRRGPFTFRLAVDAAPAPGNGRLVIVSHGSGGSPWVHVDLARTLVEAGFVVAMPWHRGDNTLDDGHPGPDSWAQRPAEVSHAIDAVAGDTRFAARLDTTRVGVYGMSAGGHTALSMAGGRWSRAGFRRHCDAHLAEDFNSCVGLIMRLHDDALDRLRLGLARIVIDWRFTDDTPQVHRDPRVAAVVAAVPSAADFDMVSLAEPAVPLALLTSGRDAWLTPRFHADRVLAACRPRCEHLADLPQGGHGAWLSPLPPGLTGLVGDLLNDPPDFDRAALPAAHRAVAGFFERQLLGEPPPAQRVGPR
ncbi:MAG TPA: dienelactone hydrolase [Burkholderiaceae bacterium]|nr:dienelactone hydrolase [Burkholderiaceae bacterium]